MIATRDGPLSMCLHNAKRDQVLLRPIELREGQLVRFWNPLTGTMSDSPPSRIEVRHTRKTARGRVRLAFEAARSANR